MGSFYVYVYIDPRNHEEFYYGKGKGARKEAHLFANPNDSKKSRRIQEIKREGLQPIIRVIARNLEEQEALLVEKTLLWKLGKLTTNIATGHFKRKFRPANQIHKPLCGFDYHNGVYYFNVGEGKYRNWDDYRKYGFISAGQGRKWRDAICGFHPGDVFIAYLKRHGFVGVGRILTEAQMVCNVVISGMPLLTLCKRMSKNSGNKNKSEYVCLVKWMKTVPREKAKTCKSPRLYTTPLIRASLDAQRSTLKFAERAFGIPISVPK